MSSLALPVTRIACVFRWRSKKDRSFFESYRKKYDRYSASEGLRLGDGSAVRLQRWLMKIGVRPGHATRTPAAVQFLEGTSLVLDRALRPRRMAPYRRITFSFHGGSHGTS